MNYMVPTWIKQITVEVGWEGTKIQSPGLTEDDERLKSQQEENTRKTKVERG